MKWKKDVVVLNDKEKYIIMKNQIKKTIPLEDQYIIDAIERGISNEQELIAIVSEKERTNEVVSSLRLAQFIIDYGTFVSNDMGHMIIEP